jgi:hypothetical protein
VGGTAFTEAPLRVPPGADVEVEGWVVDLRHHDVALDASLHLDSAAGQVVLPLRHRKVRPDVVAAFKDERFLIAGFVIVIPAASLTLGEWRMWIEYRSGRSNYFCDNGRRLLVSGAVR